ncbi:MAG: bifunctional UDP-N-acetylglucosamine diphosphorylase/glucosamine-1-phosphate N-acetyltransferase GlmU [Endozoicomonas sp. (ex Botrylloides leachii)]|nr:bifunctional UDP-N-acetylglucosamine diphosphorylase/glucosamine-1-phosphate N-acetyltransferase GlmU [Endozoicomonas sp. (ex Botrylloides leachii)]
MRTDIVILAAGQGSRMKSKLPKVLHHIAGKPMLEHVVTAARNSQPQHMQGKIHIVVGHGADQVRDQSGMHEVSWIQQNQQLGTGHAVKQALPKLKGADTVLVIYGDVPLINPCTLATLTEACGGQHLALLTATIPDPAGYGRIIRDSFGDIKAIVEHKDATPGQLAIKEVNTGIMAIPGDRVAYWLEKLSNNNAQQEYYLTDIVAMAVNEGFSIVHAQPTRLTEVQGINSRLQLSELERIYQKQQAEAFMEAGVTILDPQRIDFRGDIQIGQDVALDVNVILEGKVVLGDNVTIEPGCIIRNTKIASNVVVKAHSLLEGAVILSGCEVGPFARLRPGTELADNAKVGNFVEIKQSHIGSGSKANHLTYIGDASVGTNVNIGAGVVTCNYDGANKYKTIINDGAFIGTNSALVAPVTIGRRATTAAGSVITRDLADEELGIARGRQRNINGWKRPSKQKD